MKKYLETATGFLASQLNYIPILFVVLTVYLGILKLQPNMGKFLLLGLLPFGFYLIRAYANNLVVFFGLHLFWAALPYLLAENVTEKVFYILLAIVFFAISVYFRVAKHQKEDSILFVAMTCILAVVAYFSAVLGRVPKGDEIIVTLAIVYVIFYMLYQYIKGYLSYIKNNEVSNQNIPKTHIFKTSFSALIGFLTLFTGFALLLVKGNFFADLIYKIGDLIKRFIIWLLSFAPDAMELGKAEEEKEEAFETMYEMGENVEPVYHLPPEIIELIDNIVTIGAYVIFSVFILLITYALFRAIIEAFKIKREENEEEIVLVKEKVTRLEKKTKSKKEKEKVFRADKKIRKMYEDLIVKKTVAGRTDKKERQAVLKKLHYQTPKEQCRDVGGKEFIRSLYEKARYSSEEISKEEVKQMKEMILLESKYNKGI